MGDNIVNSPGASPASEYWLNADFDGTLAGKPPLSGTAEPTYIHEMAWHFLFAGNGGDSVIVHQPLPADFLAYAGGKDLALPRAVVHPAFTGNAEFHPFGWNAQAEALAARYSRSSGHPALEAVRKANSRTFQSGLEKEWDPACAGRAFSGAAELSDWLAARGTEREWVLKGEHGYAGTANLRLAGGPLSPDLRNRVEAIFAGNGRAVLEPWHARLADMAVLFHATPAGNVEDFRGHALFNSRDGAFLGVQVAPDRGPPAPWRDALRLNAERLAKALHAIGYHGPVGVDAYVHDTHDGPRLRPLVDVNARLSMALPAHGLARRMPERHILWTWAKPRKLDLPGDYAALDAALGADAFDPAARRGILAVSPIRLGPGPRRGPEDAQRPRRVGFALVAPDETDLARLRQAFARALGRK